MVMVVTNELRIPEESPAVTSSGDGLDGPQTARMDRIVAKHQRELKIAREQARSREVSFMFDGCFARGRRRLAGIRHTSKSWLLVLYSPNFWGVSYSLTHQVEKTVYEVWAQ